MALVTLAGCGNTSQAEAQSKTAAASKPASPAAAPVKPAEPASVTTWNGTGPLDTNTFSASGPAWNLHYSVENTSDFQIFVQRADNGKMLALAVNGPAAAKGTVSVKSPPGTYFLRVRSLAPWTIEVSDLR